MGERPVGTRNGETKTALDGTATHSGEDATRADGGWRYAALRIAGLPMSARIMLRLIIARVRKS